MREPAAESYCSEQSAILNLYRYRNAVKTWHKTIILTRDTNERTLVRSNMLGMILACTIKPIERPIMPDNYSVSTDISAATASQIHPPSQTVSAQKN